MRRRPTPVLPLALCVLGVLAVCASAACRRAASPARLLAQLEAARSSPDALRFLRGHIAYDLMGARNVSAAVAGLDDEPIPAAMRTGTPDPERAARLNAIVREGLRELREGSSERDFDAQMRRISERIAGRGCIASPADAATTAAARAQYTLSLPADVEPAVRAEFEPYRARAARLEGFHLVQCERPTRDALMLAREPGGRSREYVIIQLYRAH